MTSLNLVLLLDLDDTLVGSSQAYDVAMQKIGIQPQDPDFLEARRLVKSRFSALELGAGSQAGEWPGSHSRILYFKQWLEKKGRCSPALLLELTDAYENSVCDTLAAQWRTLGRTELFKRLRTRFSKIALVTNESVRFQAKKLKAIACAAGGDCFDAWVVSEEVGLGKPSSLPFEKVFEVLSVKPEQCWMVGDNYEKDVLPAAMLGVQRAVQTTEFRQTEAAGHSQVVKKLDELMSV